MKILLTGASGFVGRSVRGRLVEAGHDVVAVSRSGGEGMVAGPVLSSNADWRHLLRGVDAVVHAAAVAHAINRKVGRLECMETNCEGTLRLAMQAADYGVKRFVFLSTIGVLGDHTTRGHPFGAGTQPAPVTDYARSKWRAEEGLERIGRRIGLPWVVIRPPLVYGIHAPGNVGQLLRAIARGLPIPLGAVTFNRRSFVSRVSLAELIESCLTNEQAVGGRFLVSDDEALSTADFVAALGRAVGREARLVRVPVKILSILFWAKGGARIRRQLLCDLEVDMSETKRVLGWTPRLGIESALNCELSADEIP